MELNTYQNEAMRTAIYPMSNALAYTALGLSSEAGEVAGKVKKIIRDQAGVYDKETRAALIDEYADCLWYISEGLRVLDCTLEAAAQGNLNKLESRRQRGVLQGSGDAR